MHHNLCSPIDICFFYKVSQEDISILIFIGGTLAVILTIVVILSYTEVPFNCVTLSLGTSVYTSPLKVNLIKGKMYNIRFFIVKMPQNQYRIKIPVGIPLRFSIVSLFSKEEIINSPLIKVEAEERKDEYTLHLVFKEKRITLFSPAYLSPFYRNGSGKFRVSREDAITIGKELETKVDFI